jgi:hypothetical protein
MMKATTALILIGLLQLLGTDLSRAQPPPLLGHWRVEVSFANGESRSFDFEAAASGKGSLLAIVPRPNQSEPSQSSAAEWTQGKDESVSFSGSVQFPLGNVGIARGTLLCQGKFGSDGSIAGDARFFPEGQSPKNPQSQPSKSGTFKATRVVH